MALYEDLKINNLRTGKQRINGVGGTVIWENVSFTVGSEAGNVINVAGQLKDGNGNSCKEAVAFYVYVSDAAGGAVAGTAPDGGAAIGTDGTKIDTFTADKSYLIKSDSDGAFDLDVTESGAANFYVNAVQPSSGKIISSDVLAFT